MEKQGGGSSNLLKIDKIYKIDLIEAVCCGLLILDSAVYFDYVSRVFFYN